MKSKHQEIGLLRDQLHQFMLQPTSYREPTETVECLETHISWLFLTDHFVYKVKKPLQFDFLDFSTLEKRLQACRNEITLNQRLAKDTYLEVSTIYINDDGGCSFDAVGDVFEYAVKMKRLPANRMLDHLIENNDVNSQDIEKLKMLLESFYARQKSDPINAVEYEHDFEMHVKGNQSTLLALAPQPGLKVNQIKRIHNAQLGFLFTKRPLFDERIRKGKIIEGHGDLRPEHVCLTEHPVIFDCIEFNKDFRVVDVVDELSFFAIECEILDRADIGKDVLASYLKTFNDDVSSDLVAFYHSYRACVRAKVEAIRSRQSETRKQKESHIAKANRYLDLAESYSAELLPPITLIIGGFMGSGKSTLARELKAKLGWELIQSDLVRRKSFGKSQKPQSFGEGIYSEENRHKVYRNMSKLLDDNLSQGLSTIVDGSFTSEYDLGLVKEVCRSHDSLVMVLWCECPLEVAKRRIIHRLEKQDDLSEARPELLKEQYQSGQRPAEEEATVIDTTKMIDRQFQSVMKQLRECVSLLN